MEGPLNEWRPPTNAELKVIERRREKNDKISLLLGGYMLRGYKMLGDTCPVCNTILLESRQGETYCVACQELNDQENAKNSAVVIDEAVKNLCGEHPNTTTDPDSQSNSAAVQVPDRPDGSIENEVLSRAAVRPIVRPAVSSDDGRRPLCNDSSTVNIEAILRDKLAWASLQLKDEKDVPKCMELIHLITQLGSAIECLFRLPL